MMEQTPAISVVLAVYNGGAYLKQSVNSVLSQALENFELLVLDDCSADGSYEWLQSLKDERIQLFRNESNKGLFYNLNFLIKRCTSGLIKLWSQDDIMYSSCLDAFVAFHADHNTIGFSYSERDIIDENGIVIPNKLVDHTPSIISTALHAKIAYYTGSIAGNIANVCINRTALNNVGLFKENMKISADFDMWVRLARNHDTGFIKKKLIQLRDHSGQLSKNEKYYINHVREDLEVYRYLNSYVTSPLKKKGKKLMRQYKLVFYYTLMLKALIKGHLKTAAAFWREISAFDNFFILSAAFIKSKAIKASAPDLLSDDI